jgi:hypothetical protein
MSSASVSAAPTTSAGGFSALGAKVAIVAVIATTVVGGGIFAISSLRDANTPPAPIEARQTVEIAFDGGDCECGHINPDGASLSGLSDNAESIQWQIRDGTTDKILESGGGDTVGRALKAAGAFGNGSYVLRFNVRYADGDFYNYSKKFVIDKQEGTTQTHL